VSHSSEKLESLSLYLLVSKCPFSVTGCGHFLIVSVSSQIYPNLCAPVWSGSGGRCLGMNGHCLHSWVIAEDCHKPWDPWWLSTDPWTEHRSSFCLLRFASTRRAVGRGSVRFIYCHPGFYWGLHKICLLSQKGLWPGLCFGNFRFCVFSLSFWEKPQVLFCFVLF
jgi:hypothetical protein